MQNRISPPFFGTNTTGDDHGLFDFLIIPFFSISSICSFSISFSFTDNLLAFCLIGFSSPVSIVCLTIFVLPISYFPLINISSFFCITSFTSLCWSVVKFPVLYVSSFFSFAFTVNIFLTSQYPSFSNSVSASQQYASLTSSSLSYSSSSISFVSSIGITRVLYLPLISISSFSMSIFFTFSLIQSFPKINSLSAFSITSTSVTDRKSTRLNSSHDQISYAVFCLKKK